MKKIWMFFASLLLLVFSVTAIGTVNVSADDENGIDVSDAKIVYFLGDAFDYDGIGVKYMGFDIPSDNVQVEGFSTASVGSRTVTLSYQNVSVSYTITVYQPVKQIKLISVTHRTSYFVNEKISVADMKIQLVYTTDETKNVNVDEKWIKGFDTTAPAETQTLTIDFGGVTTTYDVEIKAIEFPESNFVQNELPEELKTDLQQAQNKGGRIAFIVVWTVGVATLATCLVVCMIKKARRTDR